jgi:hypothetical protein
MAAGKTTRTGGRHFAAYVIDEFTDRLAGRFCMNAVPLSGGANSPSSVFCPRQLAQFRWYAPLPAVA